MWHRKPVVAGQFYPSNSKTLEDEIDGYLLNAEKKRLGGEIIGLISPHAGYQYSAPVAAYSYQQLTDTAVEIAVVLAPSHRARFKGASIIPAGIYETPLGKIDIDEAIGEKLLEKSHFDFIKEVHNSEHSLEVQAPFLQRVLSNFKIVPVIIGSVEISDCISLAEEISSVIKNEKRKYVVVISTDLSHYHSYKKACGMDNLFIESLKRFDEDDLYNILHTDKAEACGQGPVLTGLVLCKNLGAKKVEILKYANSGDTAGSRDQVVGYLSAAIIK